MSHLVGGKLFWPYQIIFKHAVSFVVTKTLQPQICKGAVTEGGVGVEFVVIAVLCNKTANAGETGISAPGFTVTLLTVSLFRSGWLPKMSGSSYFPQIMLWQTASQHNLHTYPISKAKQKLPKLQLELQVWSAMSREVQISTAWPFFLLKISWMHRLDAKPWHLLHLKLETSDMTLMDTPMWGLWGKATELGGRNATVWAPSYIYMCIYVFVKAC